jgi:hypothetical protein
LPPTTARRRAIGAIIVNGEQAHVSQRAPCRYDVSPSNYGTGASGGSTTLSIATSSECVWTASRECHLDHVYILDNREWQRIRRLRRGYPVADDVRSGSIVVANQRVVVTQASVSLPTASSYATASDAAPATGMHVFAIAHLGLRGGQRRHR